MSKQMRAEVVLEFLTIIVYIYLWSVQIGGMYNESE
jgi:hypothetical protein